MNNFCFCNLVIPYFSILGKKKNKTKIEKEEKPNGYLYNFYYDGQGKLLSIYIICMVKYNYMDVSAATKFVTTSLIIIN